jgi:hypothetical protein
MTQTTSNCLQTKVITPINGEKYRGYRKSTLFILAPIALACKQGKPSVPSVATAGYRAIQRTINKLRQRGFYATPLYFMDEMAS